MVVVVTAAVIVLVVVVVQVLVLAVAIIDLVVLVESLFIDVLAEVVTALDFAAPASYIGDVLSGMVADVVMVFVTGIRVEVLADTNVSLMTDLEFNIPNPL